MLELSTLQRLIDPLLPGLLGVRLIETGPERVLAEMDVRPELCTAGGILHGGAYMAFADTLGAVGTVLNLQRGQSTTSIAAAAPRSGRPVCATPRASCARW